MSFGQKAPLFRRFPRNWEVRKRFLIPFFSGTNPTSKISVHFHHDPFDSKNNVESKDCFQSKDLFLLATGSYYYFAFQRYKSKRQEANDHLQANVNKQHIHWIPFTHRTKATYCSTSSSSPEITSANQHYRTNDD